jgi:predicted RNA-binding protein YlxR (DUF448 family)
VREKKDLLRLAIDGRMLRVDPKGRLPGRGLYVCRDAACVDLAKKRRALARWVDAAEAHRVLGVVRELVGGIARDREGALLGMLGLARRGGLPEVGLRGSLERLRRGEGALLVTARDISERGARVAAEAARAAGVPQVVLGTREALGRAVGGNDVVAVLVLDDNMAHGLLAAARGADGPAEGGGGDGSAVERTAGGAHDTERRG